MPEALAKTTELAGNLQEIEADLDEAARHASDALERRRHDLNLKEELASEDFEGPTWDRFVSELARYGIAVVMAWLVTGEMWVQCKKKNCWPGAPPDSWDECDRMSLAHDTVFKAIVNFRDRALAGGKWTFEGGASLKTYFIGSCVYAFPNIYRAWRNAHKPRYVLGDSFHQWAENQPAPDPDPGQAIPDRLQALDGLLHVNDSRTRTAVLAYALNYTRQEIAELLETTPGAVKQLLARQRQRGERGKG